jgi:membrane protease YdiL (CAAX protease family)
MPEPKETVWNFEDLGFFLGSILPSVVVASLVTRIIPSQAARGLAYQSVLYVLILSCLYALARVRHDISFAQATNWTLKFQGAWYCVFGAPVLALTISILGVLLGAPLIPSAVDNLTASDIPLPVVAVFAVILGPLFEELVFRGFLQPLFQQAGGKWRGLIVTSALFSLLHGAQNEWLWQYLLLLFFAGLAFGIVRQHSGSTAAAFLLHMGFNLTPLTSSIVSRN